MEGAFVATRAVRVSIWNVNGDLKLESWLHTLAPGGCIGIDSEELR